MAMMASAAAQTKSSEAGGDPAAEKSSTKTTTWRRDMWQSANKESGSVWAKNANKNQVLSFEAILLTCRAPTL